MNAPSNVICTKQLQMVVICIVSRQTENQIVGLNCGGLVLVMPVQQYL